MLPLIALGAPNASFPTRISHLHRKRCPSAASSFLIALLLLSLILSFLATPNSVCDFGFFDQLWALANLNKNTPALLYVGAETAEREEWQKPAASAVKKKPFQSVIQPNLLIILLLMSTILVSLFHC